MILINLNNQDMELKFTINSICFLEEKSGKGIIQLVDTSNFGFNTIRLLIWAGLLHKIPNLTPEIAGIWLDAEIKKDFNNFEKLSEKAMNALTESGLLGKNTKEEEKKIIPHL